MASLPLSGEMDGDLPLSCDMDGYVCLPLSCDMDGSSLARSQFAQRASTLFCCQLNVALLVIMAVTMSGELVDLLATFARGEARNPAFCERAQKILE